MDQPRAPITEAILVFLARSGSPLAFEELVLRHGAKAYGLALRTMGDPALAEDATQDAFFQAWRGLGSFRGESAFGTWLHRIVLNCCLAALRKSQREQAEPLPDSHPAQLDLDHQVEVREAVRQMSEILATLTAEQRTVFVLRHYEDWSYREIAEATGASVAAVRSRLHRARLQVLAAWEGVES